MIYIATFVIFFILEMKVLLGSGFNGLKSIMHFVAAYGSASMAIALTHIFFTSRSRIRSLKLLQEVLEEYNKCGTIRFGLKECRGLRLFFKLAIASLISLGACFVIIITADFCVTQGRYFLILSNAMCGAYVLGGLGMLSHCYTQTYLTIMKNGMDRFKKDLRMSMMKGRLASGDEIRGKIVNFSRFYRCLSKFTELYYTVVSVAFLLTIICLVMILITQYKLLFEWLLSEKSTSENNLLVAIVNVLGLMATIPLATISIHCESIITLVSLNYTL